MGRIGIIGFGTTGNRFLRSAWNGGLVGSNCRQIGRHDVGILDCLDQVVERRGDRRGRDTRPAEESVKSVWAWVVDDPPRHGGGQLGDHRIQGLIAEIESGLVDRLTVDRDRLQVGHCHRRLLGQGRKLGPKLLDVRLKLRERSRCSARRLTSGDHRAGDDPRIIQTSQQAR